MDDEFYYPLELQDEELLQQATSFENSLAGAKKKYESLSVIKNEKVLCTV